MTTLTYINRIKRIDFLIRTKSTGPPCEFASRLGISVRSLYVYLNDMKELGAPLKWSKSYGSYIYIEEGNLEICFMSKLGTGENV